jgi:hypothetical protein
MVMDAAAVIVMAATIVAGAFNSRAIMANVRGLTIGQSVVGVAQAVFVMAGVVVLVGWRRRAVWMAPAAIAWSAGILVAGTMAPSVFGGASWTAGAGAALGMIVIIAPVVFRVYRRARGR